ncbi:MAG TPA: hypothetical protein VM537_31955 [Anaerolineae bacterium]|nr:hypothetical protein [Anaerolineae bacterium]
MSDELVEHLAKKMHHEWLEVMIEQGYHLFLDCPLTHPHPCAKCRDGLVPWDYLSEEVKEVNRRGVRRILKEVGLSEKAQRGAAGKAAEARVEALERGIEDVLRMVRTEPHVPGDSVIERRLGGLFPRKEEQGG